MLSAILSAAMIFTSLPVSGVTAYAEESAYTAEVTELAETTDESAPAEDTEAAESTAPAESAAPVEEGSGASGEGATEAALAEGVAEGTTEGTSEGTTEGATEGATEGSTEETTDGSTEGTTEGSTEESTEGTTEAAEGATEAATEGTTELLPEEADKAATEETEEEEDTEEPAFAAFPGMGDDYELTADEIAEKEILAEHLQDELPEDLSEEIYEDAEDVYVLGQVICEADTEEEAQRIAKAYGGTLDSYSYGIAVIKLADGVTVSEAIAAAQQDLSNKEDALAKAEADTQSKEQNLQDKEGALKVVTDILDTVASLKDKAVAAAERLLSAENDLTDAKIAVENSNAQVELEKERLAKARDKYERAMKLNYDDLLKNPTTDEDFAQINSLVQRIDHVKESIKLPQNRLIPNSKAALYPLPEDTSTTQSSGVDAAQSTTGDSDLDAIARQYGLQLTTNCVDLASLTAEDVDSRAAGIVRTAAAGETTTLQLGDHTRLGAATIGEYLTRTDVSLRLTFTYMGRQWTVSIPDAAHLQELLDADGTLDLTRLLDSCDVVA